MSDNVKPLYPDAGQGPTNVCEETVFERLFGQLSKSLRDFLFYKSGDDGLSEDIVQDVFFKMWERCKDVPPEKAKSFLFTAANNQFLNSVEKKKVRLNFKEQSDSNRSNKEDPAYQMEMEEYRIRLEDAIAALPDGQREVFLMNRINKLKYREIAEALGVSQKAVEKRMSKALLKLKDVLNPS